MRSTVQLGFVSCLVISLLDVTPAQEGSRVVEQERLAGPFSSRPILNAPFTAEAHTVVIETRPDKGQNERRTVTRLYRSSSGQVRVEFEVPLSSSTQVGTQSTARTKRMIMLSNGDRNPLGNAIVYSLDPDSRTFRVVDGKLAAALFNAQTQFAIPMGTAKTGVPVFASFVTADVHSLASGVQASLGKARIGGIDAVGFRVNDAIPVACKVCEGLPGTSTDERWESPTLRVVVRARHLDNGDRISASYPGKGVNIEYDLTNVFMTEPPAGLFAMPVDFTQHFGGPSDPDLSIVN